MMDPSRSVIFTIPESLEVGPVTVHANSPSSRVLSLMDIQLRPASRLSSILTAPLVLTDVQVIVSSLEIYHSSPPFGDVMLMVGMSVISNTASLVSTGSPSLSLLVLGMGSETVSL